MYLSDKFLNIFSKGGHLEQIVGLSHTNFEREKHSHVWFNFAQWFQGRQKLEKFTVYNGHEVMVKPPQTR